MICGGTTAQIAARVLGQDLWSKGYLEQAPQGHGRRKGTPPVARLDGVDLVTEGILTLGQAVEPRDGRVDPRSAARRRRRDAPGAYLALGRRDPPAGGTAINPNQVADVVRGETMRMVYVKELVRELERRKKQVCVERI